MREGSLFYSLESDMQIMQRENVGSYKPVGVCGSSRDEFLGDTWEGWSKQFNSLI